MPELPRPRDAADDAQREASLAAFEAIIGQSSMGFFLADPALRLIRVNERFAQVFGKPVDEYQGRTPYDFLPRVEADRLAAALRHVRESGETAELQVAGVAGGGGRRRWAISLYRLTGHGGTPLGVAGTATDVVDVRSVPADSMILDIGPKSIADIAARLKTCLTLVWNGPLGAFETTPFDQGTVAVAREAAALTKAKALLSVAGGGDTVAALGHAGVTEDFSYVSTAGGAFLEWLEGKTLPGVAALTD